jgi:hypothetical protein
MRKLMSCAGYLRRSSVVPFLEWLPVRVKVERRVEVLLEHELATLGRPARAEVARLGVPVRLTGLLPSGRIDQISKSSPVRRSLTKPILPFSPKPSVAYPPTRGTCTSDPR